MNRGFWFLAGAGAGIYTMTKARRAAEAFTPEGLRDRLAALSLGAHLLGTDLRAEMTARESELRRRLGVPDGDRELPGPEARETDAAGTTPPLRLTRKGND
ncbi:MAG TPA: DUF6167 family protein [Nocardioidaceae bacterium]|jgi:hypothetical protein